MRRIKTFQEYTLSFINDVCDNIYISTTVYLVNRQYQPRAACHVVCNNPIRIQYIHRHKKYTILIRLPFHKVPFKILKMPDRRAGDNHGIILIKEIEIYKEKHLNQ